MPLNGSSTPFEGAARFNDVHGWLTNAQRMFMLEEGLPPPPLNGPPPPGWTPMREVGTNLLQALRDTPDQFRLGTASPTVGQMLFEGMPIYHGTGFIEINGVRIPLLESPTYTSLQNTIRAVLELPRGRLIAVNNTPDAHASLRTFLATPPPDPPPTGPPPSGPPSGPPPSGPPLPPTNVDPPLPPTNVEPPPAVEPPRPFDPDSEFNRRSRTRVGTPGSNAGASISVSGNIRIQEASEFTLNPVPEPSILTPEQINEMRAGITRTIEEALREVAELAEDNPRRVAVRDTIYRGLRYQSRATIVAAYNGLDATLKPLLAPDLDTLFETMFEERFTNVAWEPLIAEHQRAIQQATSRNGPGPIAAENVNIDGSIRRIVGRIAIEMPDGAFTIIGHEENGTCYRMQTGAAAPPPGATVIRTPRGFSGWCIRNTTGIERGLRGEQIFGALAITYNLYRDVYTLINDTEEEHNQRQAARWGLTSRTWARIQAVPHFRNLGQLPGGGGPRLEVSIGQVLTEMQRLLRNPAPPGVLDDPITELRLLQADWQSIRRFINSREGSPYRFPLLLQYIDTQIENGDIIARTREAQRVRTNRRVEEAILMLSDSPIDALDIIIHEPDVRFFVRERPRMMNELFVIFSFDGDLQYLFALGIGWEDFYPNYFSNTLARSIVNINTAGYSDSGTTPNFNQYLDNMRRPRYAVAAMWQLTVRQSRLHHPRFPPDQETRVTQDYIQLARSLSDNALTEIEIPSPANYRDWIPNTQTLVNNYRRNMATRIRVLQSLERSMPVLPAADPRRPVDGALHIPFTDQFVPRAQILRALNVELCCAATCPLPGVPAVLPEASTLEELYDFVGLDYDPEFPWDGDYPGDEALPADPNMPARPSIMTITERLPNTYGPPITPDIMSIVERYPDIPPPDGDPDNDTPPLTPLIMRIMERLPLPVEPPVVPGVDCPSAGIIALGQTYGPFVCETGEEHWFRYTVLTTGTYKVLMSTTGAGGGLTTYEGTSCGSKSQVFAGSVDGESCSAGSYNTPNYAWLKVSASIGDITYTIQFASGACS